MHEVSIMTNVLELAFTHMRRARAVRIERLRLRVGKLSGVVIEALEFAFEALKEGTPAATATLDIEYVPLCLHCADCDVEYEAVDYLAECPGCGSWHGVVRRGQELDLVSLELFGEECHDNSDADSLGHRRS